MRVVFLGNHTVGVHVLQALKETAEVVGVVAHPLDPEDGVRYESVFDFAQEWGWNVIRGKGRDVDVTNFVSSARPDLLWITDYRYLISSELVKIAPLGAVNLHPSLLPAYRGRASINWAILNGETRLGLTAHFVNEGMDTGDIIEQLSYEIGDEQDVGDCLNLLYPMYGRITLQVMSYFASGIVPRKQQDHSRATSFPRRRPEDGRIDWTLPARSIFNLVRAVARPYPGAFTNSANKTITVWKSKIVSEEKTADLPGTVLAKSGPGPEVQCGSGTLLLTSMENGAEDFLNPGCRLG